MVSNGEKPIPGVSETSILTQRQITLCKEKSQNNFECANISCYFFIVWNIWCCVKACVVATGVYALLLKFLQKNSPHDVQKEGGRGGQRLFEQC